MSEAEQIVYWLTLQEICSRTKGIVLTAIGDTFKIEYKVSTANGPYTEYFYTKTLEKCGAFISGYRIGIKQNS